MKYDEINEFNRKQMRSEVSNNLNFEWEDTSLLDNLIKKIDDIKIYQTDPEEFKNDKEIHWCIDKLFNDLYSRKINNEFFLSELKKIFDILITKYPDLSYSDRFKYEFYENIISQSNRLIIKGNAGIGKSYFIYKLEENLTKEKIPHLCVYGKYFRNKINDCLENISKLKKEFYLIIDAINEFDKDEQLNIIEQINKLSCNNNINIIVTYRTSSLSQDVSKMLDGLSFNRYEFMGVDFESSIQLMIENYGIEVVKYLDVVESSNPLYIKMLRKIFASPKLKNENLINGIVRITYIMEFYIKELCGTDNWRIIKRIGEYLLENEISYITNEILKIICGDRYTAFINQIGATGIMYISKIDDETYYGFNIQQLADYIIARPLFKIFDSLSDDEIINLINNKIEKIPTLSDSITILIFEKYKDKDIKKAMKIYATSNLKDNSGVECFKKINFTKEQIMLLQKNIKVLSLITVFRLLGGFPNRPFNCTSYFNEELVNKKYFNIELIEEYHERDYILHLKNIVFSIPFLENQNDYMVEYMYYAFWLMSSSYERVRNMAIKIVYDLAYKMPSLQHKLKMYYYKVNDLYLKKGIIHVLSKLPKNKSTLNFMNKILINKNEIDSEIISRVAIYLEKVYLIPILKKRNLYNEISGRIKIDENIKIHSLITMADIYEKNVLKFDRFSKSEYILSIYPTFIINKANKVFKYNKKMWEKFSCIKNNGYCKYSYYREEFSTIVPPIDIKKIDDNKLYIIFQEVFKYISNKCNLNISNINKFDFHFNKFENSLFKKVLLLSQDIVLGSLMGNYYTEQFSMYDDELMIGYKVFSYFYGNEDKIYLTTPISPYNDLIDKLNMIKCDEIELYKERDVDWLNNVDLSIEVCSKLIKKIEYNNEDWSFIGGSVQKIIKDFSNEYYSCYMGINPEKYLEGNDNARKFTIENEKYYGNLTDYSKVDYPKNMSVPSFKSNSDDIKDSYLSFPSPRIVDYLNLSYDFKTSSWKNNVGETIIICDNNPKKYYEYPISGAVYMKTKYLDQLKQENIIVYWCYTEKSLKQSGWNDKAELHLQFDGEGNLEKKYLNSSLKIEKADINKNCECCKYGIYQKHSSLKESYDIKKLEEILKEYGIE